MGRTTNTLGFNFWEKQEILLLSKVSTPALGLILPPIEWVSRALSPGEECLGSGTDILSHSSKILLSIYQIIQHRNPWTKLSWYVFLNFNKYRTDLQSWNYKAMSFTVLKHSFLYFQINHHFATSRSVVWVASEILTELLNSAEKCANENYYLTFLVLQKFQNNFYTKNVSTFAFCFEYFEAFCLF